MSRLGKGKETEEWDSVRRELVKEFAHMGITYCEIQFDGCRRYPEGFAHTLTRNNLGKWGSEERARNIREVVLACNYCHDKVEKKPFMTDFLRSIIQRRQRENFFEDE